MPQRLFRAHLQAHFADGEGAGGEGQPGVVEGESTGADPDHQPDLSPRRGLGQIFGEAGVQLLELGYPGPEPGGDAGDRVPGADRVADLVPRQAGGGELQVPRHRHRGRRQRQAGLADRLAGDHQAPVAEGVGGEGFVLARDVGRVFARRPGRRREFGHVGGGAALVVRADLRLLAQQFALAASAGVDHQPGRRRERGPAGSARGGPGAFDLQPEVGLEEGFELFETELPAGRRFGRHFFRQPLQLPRRDHAGRLADPLRDHGQRPAQQPLDHVGQGGARFAADRSGDRRRRPRRGRDAVVDEEREGHPPLRRVLRRERLGRPGRRSFPGHRGFGEAEGRQHRRFDLPRGGEHEGVLRERPGALADRRQGGTLVGDQPPRLPQHRRRRGLSLGQRPGRRFVAADREAEIELDIEGEGDRHPEDLDLRLGLDADLQLEERRLVGLEDRGRLGVGLEGDRGLDHGEVDFPPDLAVQGDHRLRPVVAVGRGVGAGRVVPGEDALEDRLQLDVGAAGERPDRDLLADADRQPHPQLEHRREGAAGDRRHPPRGHPVENAEIDPTAADEGEDLDREGALVVAFVREAEVDEEVAVGVDLDDDEAEGDRDLAQLDVAEGLGDLQFAAEHPQARRQLLVEDLEAQAGQRPRPLAVERDRDAVEVGVVEDQRDLDRLQQSQVDPQQPPAGVVEDQRAFFERVRLPRLRRQHVFPQQLHRLADGVRRLLQAHSLTEPEVAQLEQPRALAGHRRRRVVDDVPGQRRLAVTAELLVEEAAFDDQVDFAGAAHRVADADLVEVEQDQVGFDLVGQRDLALLLAQVDGQGEARELDPLQHVPRRLQ